MAPEKSPFLNNKQSEDIHCTKLKLTNLIDIFNSKNFMLPHEVRKFPTLSTTFNMKIKGAWEGWLYL